MIWQVDLWAFHLSIERVSSLLSTGAKQVILILSCYNLQLFEVGWSWTWISGRNNQMSYFDLDLTDLKLPYDSSGDSIDYDVRENGKVVMGRQLNLVAIWPGMRVSCNVIRIPMRMMLITGTWRPRALMNRAKLPSMFFLRWSRVFLTIWVYRVLPMWILNGLKFPHFLSHRRWNPTVWNVVPTCPVLKYALLLPLRLMRGQDNGCKRRIHWVRLFRLIWSVPTLTAWTGLIELSVVDFGPGGSLSWIDGKSFSFFPCGDLVYS